MPLPRAQIPAAQYHLTYVNGSYRRRRMRSRGRRRSRFSDMFRSLLDSSEGLDEQPPAASASAETPSPTTWSAVEQTPANHHARTHRQRRQAAEEAWAVSRETTLDAFVKSLPLLNTACSVPSCEGRSEYRCLDCGYHTVFCADHVKEYHQGSLHLPEMWKDGCFVPALVEQEPWVSETHQCGHGKIRSVTVVDVKGRQHSVPVTFCECRKDIQTLVSLRLWPATPSRAVVAFSFDLMEWMRLLFLDCHVSLSNICQCVSWLSPPVLQNKVSNIYKLLAEDTFTEYRYFREQLDAMHLGPTGSPPACPACPQEAGKQFISLDAIFGLKRWQKSGTSDNPPRHGTRYFLNQSEVDKFLESYDCSSGNASSSCSNFQAGDHLRRKTQSKKVDETGVFGAVCRHEMPVKFFSLKQGERLGNAVYLIRHIMQNKNTDTQLYILYDIACKLEAHLKKPNQSRPWSQQLLQQLHLAIPAFHVYGHKPDCQIKLSPRRLPGFCLCDGEQVERLWSFLRKFANITKEMTPSNRVDALTDALLQYSRRMHRNMAKILVHRYHKAEDVNSAATKELAGITAHRRQDGSAFSLDDIRMWMADESPSEPPPEATGVDLSPSEVYALKLKEFYKLRQEYEKECLSGASSIGSIPLLLCKLRRIETELIGMENGSQRWGEDSIPYKAALSQNASRVRKSFLFKLHSLCVDRWFLIVLKQKYADGQAIAKMLGGQIKTATNKLRKEMEACNKELEMLSSFTPNNHHPLIFSDVSDVSSDLWKCLETRAPGRNTSMPIHLKRHFMDVVHKLDRSTEEMAQLKMEMQNMFTFFVNRKQGLNSLLSNESSNEGQQCLIKGKLDEVTTQINECFRMFHPRFIDLSEYEILSDLHGPEGDLEVPDIEEVCETMLELMGEDSSDEES